MSWRTSDLSSAYSDGIAHFKAKETRPQLTVTHHPSIDTRAASIYNPTDDTSVAFVQEFGIPKIVKRRSGAVEFSEEVTPPSDHLISLINSHYKNRAWMPLLDALAEEYPEHFESAVAEHTRARSESDATHYARAVSATLSATR